MTFPTVTGSTEKEYFSSGFFHLARRDKGITQLAPGKLSLDDRQEGGKNRVILKGADITMRAARAGEATLVGCNGSAIAIGASGLLTRINCRTARKQRLGGRCAEIQPKRSELRVLAGDITEGECR